MKNETTKQENTQLIKRTPVESTPFEIVEVEGRIFGALGIYKITEDMPSIEATREELSRIDWNRIIQVSTLIFNFLNSKNV